MRVIAGKARGTRLQSPTNMDIRPTSDRVKESVFGILDRELMDAVVVDLFSGTGNLGIESLSRGAKAAYFVDQSKESIKIITYNLEKTRFLPQATVIHKDAVTGVKQLAMKGIQADMIFMDPPYHKGLIEPVFEAIEAGKLLAPEGTIIVEHGRTEVLQESYGGFQLVRKKDYGNTSVSFYQLREDKE